MSKPKVDKPRLKECSNPRKAWRVGFNPSTGKEILKITSFTQKVIDYHGRILTDSESNYYKIPCGQCAYCRMQKAREWANRLMLELQYHQEAWFVTLTFDDEHIDAQCGPNHSLQKKHLQKFMKDLRERVYPDKLRFYGIGEYGSQTARPHYHLILFGLHLASSDRHFYKLSELGYAYENSDLICSVWPYGFNVVAPVTWESCCYTARYMMKKLGDGSSVYEDYGLEKPFSLMSRCPGIGAQYFIDHQDEIFEKPKIVLGTEKGSLQFAPPRYFKKLRDAPPDQLLDLGAHSPSQAELSAFAVKDMKNRAFAIERSKAELSMTDLDEESYLKRLGKEFDKVSEMVYNFRNKV